jgi:methionyl aminopeptidase
MKEPKSMTVQSAAQKNNKFTPDGIELHTSAADFEGMRKAGRLAAEILDMITDYVVPDVTTEELNRLCHAYCTEAGAIPAPLGYRGSSPIPFPKSICTSINRVICHGIPGDQKLKEGDILNIDVTVILDGWYGDSSRMYLVGDKISVMARRLVDTTYDCLMAGIEAVKPGAKLGDIGRAIQDVAHKQRFSVVRDFCGHGLGRSFHAPPSVMHYFDPREYSQFADVILEPGMFFTIEPMINEGKYHSITLQKDKNGNPDGWTAVTKDKKLSAQFEHSLAVTESGFEIFTLSPKGFTKPPYK